MRKTGLLLLLSFLGTMGFAGLFAATTPLASRLTTNVSVFYNYLPIVILAVFVSVGIAVLYYAMGWILNNSTVKAGAISEFEQVLGTVVIVVIILAFFNVYGSAIISSSSLTKSLTAICGAGQLGSANTLVTFFSTATAGPTQTICESIVGSGQGSTITSNIDYGLGATYAIIANLSSQEAANLDALNVFEGYYSTLSTFTPQEYICWPNTCIEPLKAPIFGYVVYSYSPFSLYDKIRGTTLYVGTEALISFYISIFQLIIIIIMLFAWPYLLAAGIILRASFFTRKAGGLLMAIVIVAIVLYPLLNLFEYTSLTNTQLSPIGASSIPTVSLTGQAPCPTADILSSSVVTTVSSLFSAVSCGTISNPAPVVSYTDTKLNFYVIPPLENILNHDGCWPPGGSVLLSDILVAGFYSIPGYGQYLAIKDIIGAFAGSLPSPAIPWFHCNPSNVIQSIFDLAKLYGMVFATTVLLPVLNILILLSAVKNISGLLGGDTRIVGLGKLV